MKSTWEKGLLFIPNEGDLSDEELREMLKSAKGQVDNVPDSFDIEEYIEGRSIFSD